MATGTGKTFLTVAQIYRFSESKLGRRILFLVDRKALAAQAVREFNAFNTPKGNKFTQEYEVYSQRFQREDFGDDDAIRSESSAERIPHRAKAEPHVCLCLDHPAHGAESLRRGRLLRAISAATPIRRRRRPTRHSDPRLRPDHRRRMPSRLHARRRRAFGATRSTTSTPSSRPHGHASGTHDGAIR